MRKIIAAINMTLDGHCDHDAIEPDEEIHQHYTELLKDTGAILYGRTTFQLMEYWKPFLKVPSGDSSMDDFARAINEIPKIVFSHSMQETGWESAALAEKSLEEEVADLRKHAGKDVLVGSRSLILQLLQLGLLDELQLCVHPVIAGKGLPLFQEMKVRRVLRLVKTRSFGGGAVLLYYRLTYGDI